MKDLTYHFLLLSGEGGIVRVKWFGIGIHGHGIAYEVVLSCRSGSADGFCRIPVGISLVFRLASCLSGGFL